MLSSTQISVALKTEILKCAVRRIMEFVPFFTFSLLTAWMKSMAFDEGELYTAKIEYFHC